jgi:hypothetical protein
MNPSRLKKKLRLSLGIPPTLIMVLGSQLKTDQSHASGSAYGCLSIMGSVADWLWPQENNPLGKYLEMLFDSGLHNGLLYAQFLRQGLEAGTS